MLFTGLLLNHLNMTDSNSRFWQLFPTLKRVLKLDKHLKELSVYWKDGCWTVPLLRETTVPWFAMFGPSCFVVLCFYISLGVCE